MDSKAVEKSFHHNRAARLPGSFLNGAMEIEDHLRLAETRREPVPRLGTIDAAAGIGDQAARAIVDWKYDAMVQESGTGIIADPKTSRRGRVNRALV